MCFYACDLFYCIFVHDIVTNCNGCVFLSWSQVLGLFSTFSFTKFLSSTCWYQPFLALCSWDYHVSLSCCHQIQMWIVNHTSLSCCCQPLVSTINCQPCLHPLFTTFNLCRSSTLLLVRLVCSYLQLLNINNYQPQRQAIAWV